MSVFDGGPETVAEGQKGNLNVYIILCVIIIM